MMTLQVNEFDPIRQLIERECGICVNEDKLYLLETRLGRLLTENDCDNYAVFYQKITADQTLKNKVIDAMTTNETLWFRDTSPFECFSQYLFPQFSEKLRSGEKQQIRVWSAACSTGQEPYSLAITSHEFARLGYGNELMNGQLSIFATDISPSVLFIAKNARYDALSMSRGMPDELKQRYFEESGRIFALKNELKNMVTFQQVNLLDSFEAYGKFDVVMLRNVAIYFSTDVKKQIFEKIAKSLNPGGYLIIGATESLMGITQDFKPCQYGKCNFYQVNR